MTDVVIDVSGPGARTALEAAARAVLAAQSAEESTSLIQTGANTALGVDTIPPDATGAGSAAFGEEALGKLTTGNNLTAVGKASLRDAKSASDSVAIGAGSERMNEAGSRNLTAGSSAALFRSSGNDNVTLGFDAQGGVTSGGDANVVAGRSALRMYAGSEAVAVGAYAGENSTGARSTFVGALVGHDITGEYNLGLGYNALNAPGQMLDANNSIALGFNAITTKSDQISLGNDGHDELRLFGQVMFRKAGLGGGAVMIGNAGNLTAVGGGTVAIGHTAGFSLGLADSCVLIGYECGYNVTSGGNNTAIGARALLSATTASDCTAVGAGALNKMVTGVGTTAVGRYALQCVVEGGNNTALGDAAGRNLAGEQNFLGGYGVMRYGYANSYNVVIGQGALYNAGKPTGTLPEDGGSPGALVRAGGVGTPITGPHNPSNYNAVIGHLAFENTTGGGHTGLGANAGRTLTGGSDMICIGRNAGFGSGQKVDATGAVVIGVGAVSTRNNEIVIGKAADTHVTLAGVTMTKAQLQALVALVS